MKKPSKKPTKKQSFLNKLTGQKNPQGRIGAREDFDELLKRAAKPKKS